jgi:hypothetical protein
MGRLIDQVSGGVHRREDHSRPYDVGQTGAQLDFSTAASDDDRVAVLDL